MHMLKSNCAIVARKIEFAEFVTYLDKRQNMKATNKNDSVEVKLNENNKKDESREKYSMSGTRLLFCDSVMGIMTNLYWTVCWILFSCAAIVTYLDDRQMKASIRQ